MTGVDLDWEVEEIVRQADDPPEPDDDDQPDDWDYVQEDGDDDPGPVHLEEPEPGPKPSRNIAEFLDQDDPEYDWVIPGLLERGDRLILTGPEGGGKSTFLRQLATQTAAGVHPFTLETIPPVRTLFVDFENSSRHLRRQLRPLHAKVAQHLDPDRLRVISAPAGIDLLNEHWRRWLDERLGVNSPDVLIAGPIYKMAGGDPISEEVARAVATTIDQARTKHRCAVVLEAHTPYAANGGKRPLRPYGASLWSRWPEFGLHLSAAGELTHWRGARDERTWPAILTRGGEWPWTAADNRRDEHWVRIAEACFNAQSALSRRSLAERLGTSPSSIQRAIKAHEAEWKDIEDLYGRSEES